MTQTFARNRFTWLMYLLLAFYGYFINILGPITPFLMDELKLTYTQSSLHFTAFAFGIILVGLGGHWVIRRVGRWRALWLGAFGLSLGAGLLLAGRTPVVTIGAAFLMGLVGSLILSVVPSALADEHGELRTVAISEANVVSSVVCAAAPLLVGLFAGRAPALGGWRLALAVAMLAPVLLRVIVGRVSFPEAGSNGAGRSAGAAVGQAGNAPAYARAALPACYWLYWTALVLAISTEFCMIFWSADYLEKTVAMPKASAAQAVSLFLGGMIIGRLAGSRLVIRFGATQVITSSLLVAMVGFGLYWAAPVAWLGAAGLFVTGLGVASLYPMIISLAIGASGGNTVQASARSSLASGTAIFCLPLVLGRLADAVGIRMAYGVVFVLLVGVFVMIQAAGKAALAVEEGRVSVRG